MAAAAGPESIGSAARTVPPTRVPARCDPAWCTRSTITGIPSGRCFPLRLRDVHPLDRPGLPRCVRGAAPGQPTLPWPGGQHDLPVDARRLAASVELRDPPHADQRVRPAAQHQLLQVADPLEVPGLRRLEDPLPQPPYVVLDWAPVDRRPSRGRRPPVRSPERRRRGPTALSWRPTCPSVPVPSSSLLTGSPGPRQHPFGSGHLPGIRPVIRDGRRRSRPCCPGFLSPFGRRHSLLGPSCSRRGLGLPHGRPTGPARSPDPDGVSTFRTRETRPGWVPPLPRGGGVHPAGQMPPAGACRFSAASPAPRYCIPSPGLILTRHQRGFTRVHPSGLPLACGPRMERGPLGFSPELRTPPLPATHVRVGTGHRALTRDYVIDDIADLQSTQPLNTCDLVSHQGNRSRRRCQRRGSSPGTGLTPTGPTGLPPARVTLRRARVPRTRQ